MKLSTSSFLFAQFFIALTALPGQAANIDPSEKSKMYSKLHSECVDGMLSTEADYDTKNTICGCTAKWTLYIMEKTFEDQVFVRASYSKKGREFLQTMFRGNANDMYGTCVKDYFKKKAAELEKDNKTRSHSSHSVIIMPSPQANIQSPAASSIDPTCALARASGLDWCDTTLEFSPRYRPEWQFMP